MIGIQRTQTVILGAALTTALATNVRAAPMLEWPVQDELGSGIYVMAYADQSPGSDATDYRCQQQHTYDGHRGTDFSVYSFRAMDKGVWVVAAAPGTVSGTRFDQFDRNYEPPYLGEGNFVRILHEDGSSALYWHLREDSVAVKVGEQVVAGQRLGQIASSGASPIPHLHFEIWENGSPIDPFGGPCSQQESLWKAQPRYAGDEDFVLFSAGITDQDIPLANGEYQLNLGLRPLKDTPLSASMISGDAISLNLWTHFQGLAGAEYEVSLIDPTGAQRYSRTHRLSRKRSFGWWVNKVQTVILGSDLDHGVWQFRIEREGQRLHDQPFMVGSESRYPPRFYPTSGVAARVDEGSRRVPLDFIGASADDVRLISVGMPSGVRIVDNELRIRADIELEARIQEGYVAAVDSHGEYDTFVVQFIDPRAPADLAWIDERTDRLSAAATGAQFNVETSGQGLFYEYIANQDQFFMGWFSFGLSVDAPANDGPDWVVGLGRPERNRVVLDLRSVANGVLMQGSETVISEPGSVGTLALQLSGCRSVASANLSGQGQSMKEVHMQRIAVSDGCRENDDTVLTELERQINGNWFDPQVAGQGMLFEYVPGQNALIGNWFAFDLDGARVWYLLVGDFDDESTSMSVYLVPSGEFNQPATSEATLVGTATIEWGGECSPASFTFSPIDGESRVNTIQRVSSQGC